MIVNGNKTIKEISAKIPIINQEVAKAYIQGAVHSYCNNNSNNEISVKALFGGSNKDWDSTPLQCIYDYHFYIGKSKDAFLSAAIDVGWLLKKVLLDDKYREFEFIGKGSGNVYKLKRQI